MSTLRLTLREPPAQRVDLSLLIPDRLVGKAAGDIAAMELTCGNRRLRVDDLFAVSGTFAGEIEFAETSGKLDRIGAGMSHGRITVRGHAGAYVGAEMRGGIIEVHGSVGAYAACKMRGGLLHIPRDAGDFLGAGLPGDRRGMRGGTVVVGRNAGARAGDRMRRGMVLIEGNVGDYCGSRMLAGTIAVAGGVGAFPGMAMRRGTLLLEQPPPELIATFQDCGEYAHAFLTLLVRSWRGLPGRFGTLPEGRVRARRYMGDLANDGRGEILVWV